MSCVLKCSACNIEITKQLEQLPYPSMMSDEMEHDRIPVGYYAIVHGHYIINLKDVINTEHHPDKKRLAGCCGLDGQDGMNIVCSQGHEVGTEQSDCWVSHAVTFDRNAVWLERRGNHS